MGLDFSLYAGLFLVAFLAATLIPAQSELALAALLTAGDQPAWALITVASVGNVAGSTVNWALGRYGRHFSGRRWFPFRPETLARAEGWYGRYGRWSLLLAWAPVIASSPSTTFHGAGSFTSGAEVAPSAVFVAFAA